MTWRPTLTIVPFLVLTACLFAATQGSTGKASREGKAYVEGRRSVWKPERGSRQEWLKYHGMKKEMFLEVKALVKTCNILTAANANRTLSEAEMEAMDEFLWGSVPTRDQALECIRQQSKRQKRKVWRFSRYPKMKWGKLIFYVFDGSHTADDRMMITAAMRQWEKETCLRFKELPVNTRTKEQYLIFTNVEKNGCWSFIGRIPVTHSTPQQLNLETGKCTGHLGRPMHEIAHALGLWHEHVRPDRDHYVHVHVGNVLTDKLNNFAHVQGNMIVTGGVHYDYGSVMHYHSKAYARDPRRRTITPVNLMHTATMGQRVTASFLDSKVLNQVYCNDVCRRKLPCKNGGYTDPKNCRRCRCPEGLGGRLCESHEASTGACKPTSGGVIKLSTSAERCVNSRNYFYKWAPNYYNSDKCNWIIKAPRGCRVQVRFQGQFGLYSTRGTGVCHHWVELKYRRDKSRRGPRFCGYRRPLFNGYNALVSDSNEMVVSFNAEYPIVKNRYSPIPSRKERRGFQLCYRISNTNCLPKTTTTTTTRKPTTTTRKPTTTTRKPTTTTRKPTTTTRKPTTTTRKPTTTTTKKPTTTTKKPTTTTTKRTTTTTKRTTTTTTPTTTTTTPTTTTTTPTTTTTKRTTTTTTPTTTTTKRTTTTTTPTTTTTKPTTTTTRSTTTTTTIAITTSNIELALTQHKPGVAHRNTAVLPGYYHPISIATVGKQLSTKPKPRTTTTKPTTTTTKQTTTTKRITTQHKPAEPKPRTESVFQAQCKGLNCDVTVWMAWSGWGSCTRPCSGCGVQVRRRLSRSPRGRVESQRRHCNTGPCLPSERRMGHRVAPVHGNVIRLRKTASVCCFRYSVNAVTAVPIWPPKKCRAVNGFGLVTSRSRDALMAE